jgi:hypothetical protein
MVRKFESLKRVLFQLSKNVPINSSPNHSKPIVPSHKAYIILWV